MGWYRSPGSPASQAQRPLHTSPIHQSHPIIIYAIAKTRKFPIFNQFQTNCATCAGNSDDSGAGDVETKRTQNRRTEADLIEGPADIESRACTRPAPKGDAAIRTIRSMW